MKALAAASRLEMVPALRVGGNQDEVWLDLGGRDWELIQATRGGWRLVADGIPDVRFVRKPGMRPLPVPVKGGNIRELRAFLNVRETDFVLDVGWLLGALRLARSYPPEFIVGGADRAKTTGVRVRQRIIDPNLDVRPFRLVDDLFIAALHSWIPTFDNLTEMPGDISDGICMIATGSAYGKRALRTDADQFIIQVARPMLFGGIPIDLAERDDLASRSIVLELPLLGDDDVKFEEEFWQEFEAARPRILGCLLDGVVGALRDYQGIDLRGWGRIRMSEFARWAEAGCR